MSDRSSSQESCIAISVVFCLLWTAFPLKAHAFYAWQGEKTQGDARAQLRVFGIAYDNPEDDFFYENESNAGIAELARLLLQAKTHNGRWAYELNAYQAYIPASLSGIQAGLGTPLDVERSAALEKSFSDDNFARLAMDRLNLRWTHERLDLILGRQPINLATTFYFTPNDFFAPFAAQTFYRLYKPGVDAIRSELRLGNLSQLSLIGVAGYAEDADSGTGWSDSPTGERSSYLARASTTLQDFEWTLLGGRVRQVKIAGGALQGELFQWLGLRAEGHVAEPDATPGQRNAEWVIGLEHRWENSFNLRLEYFHHGSGADSEQDYLSAGVPASGQIVYLARRYTALGAGYEFTPLLNGEMVLLSNWIDSSYLLSLNAVYSLGDETELAISATLPMGEKPDGPNIETEFGLYPYTLNLELRAYF